MNLEYKEKYLKYKKKYYNLKKQLGGVSNLQKEKEIELKDLENKYTENKNKLLEKIENDFSNAGYDKLNPEKKEEKKKSFFQNHPNSKKLQELEREYINNKRNINVKYNQQKKQQQKSKQPQQQSQKGKNPREETDIIKLGNIIKNTKIQLEQLLERRQKILNKEPIYVTVLNKETGKFEQKEFEFENLGTKEKRKYNEDLLDEIAKIKNDIKTLEENKKKLDKQLNKMINNATGVNKQRLQEDKKIIQDALAHQTKLGNINLILAKKSLEKENEYMAEQKKKADKKHQEQLAANKQKIKNIQDTDYKVHLDKIKNEICTDKQTCEKNELTFDCNPLNIFKCPISLCIMENPVKAADGYLYEEKQITKWFSGQNKKTPMGTKEISFEVSTVRNDVKDAIIQWKEAHKSLSKMKMKLETATKSSDLKNLGGKIDLSLVKKLFEHDSKSFQNDYSVLNHKRIIGSSYIIGDHSEDIKRVNTLEKDYNDTKTKINRKIIELKKKEEAERIRREEAERRIREEAERQREEAERQRKQEAKRQRTRTPAQQESLDAYWRKKEQEEEERIDRENAARRERFILEQQNYWAERALGNIL